MPVCPRQCHFGCVVVGIEHGVHEREARVCCVLSGLMAVCVRRDAQGGAIYASSSSSINIQHTTFVGNQAVGSSRLIVEC